MNRYQQRLPAPGEDFRVADRLEILDLTWRFAAAMDIGDLDMFRDCFAPRILWDLSRNPVRWTGGPADEGPVELDRDAFMDIVRGRDAAKRAVPADRPVPRAIFTQHGLLNPIITFLAPDQATVLAYNHEHYHEWFADGAHEHDGVGQDQGGFYHIDMRRLGDRWRISALRLEIRFFDPKALFGRLAPRHDSGA